MAYRSLRSCSVLIVLIALSLYAKDKQPPAPMANIHFTVVKDANEKPVRNASVVLHPVNKNGTQGKGGFQLKTDNDGKTETEGIPYGTIRIQVLAPGFQSFGDDYTVDKPDVDIQVRLKRPSDQMTIYDKPSGTTPTEAPKPATTPPTPKPN